jgi:hypothetical protein
MGLRKRLKVIDSRMRRLHHEPITLSLLPDYRSGRTDHLRAGIGFIHAERNIPGRPETFWNHHSQSAPSDRIEATFELPHDMKAWMDAEFHPAGYNIGWNCGPVAGQAAMHAHMHVIPRFPQEPIAEGRDSNLVEVPSEPMVTRLIDPGGAR